MNSWFTKSVSDEIFFFCWLLHSWSGVNTFFFTAPQEKWSGTWGNGSPGCRLVGDIIYAEVWVLHSAEMMRAKYVFFLPFILPALCQDSPFLAYSHEDKKAKQEEQIIHFVKPGLKGVKSEPKMIEHKYKEKGRNTVSCMEKVSIFKEQPRIWRYSIINTLEIKL